jgi:long-chain acyl-CoA synthetase
MENFNYFYELIKNYSKEQKNKIALCDYQSELNYEQLEVEISKRKILIEKNFGKRKAILNIGKNTVDFIINHLAIISADCISVPLDSDSKKDYVEFIENEIKPVAKIIEKNNFLTEGHVIEFNKMSENTIIIKSEFISRQYEDDINVIMYTTGTSGNPKGVVLNLNTIKHTANNIVDYCHYNNNSFQLITLPLSHSFGMGQLYSMLICGGSAYLEIGMARGKRIKLAFEKYPINGFPTTPAGLEIIYEIYKDLFYKNRNRIKDMIINSAPLSREKAQKLLDMMPTTRVFTYYGMTEASRASMMCLNDVTTEHYDYVGKPMNGNKIRIDSESNEILLSGLNISNGYLIDYLEKNIYYKKDEIRSGDLGEIDRFGYLRIIGRIKDQINIGGYKVSPTEVEIIIETLPYVKKIAIIGVNDNNNEEKIIAYVIKNEYFVNESIFIGDISRILEYYKNPKEFIYVDELPQLSNGKIDRKLLKEMYMNGLNI